MSRPAPSTIMPADAAVLGEPAHQPAADGRLGVAAGIHHDDVAGLAHLQRLQRIDEIALGELNGERLARPPWRGTAA
jgi:hypothetical protein